MTTPGFSSGSSWRYPSSIEETPNYNNIQPTRNNPTSPLDGLLQSQTSIHQQDYYSNSQTTPQDSIPWDPSLPFSLKYEYPSEASLDSHRKQNKKEKIFIGGISLNVCLGKLARTLERASQSRGKLTISMIKRLKSKNYSGYGYLTSTEDSDLPRLLELKTFKYKSSWIGLKPFLTKKGEIKQLKQAKDNRKLHLKGLTHQVSEKDLENYFSQYGDINHIQINKSLSTGLYKGFAFIEFSTEEALDLATVKSLHHIKGVSIVCEKSKLKEVEQGDKKDPFLTQPSLELLDYSRSMTESVPPKNFLRHLRSSRLKTYLRPELDQVQQNHCFRNMRFNISPPILPGPDQRK